MDENVEKVKNVIDKSLGEDLISSVENIKNNENLYNLGLDSLNVVKLVIAIENEFDIEFDDDDIASDNWKSIDAIVNLLKKRGK